MRSPRWVLPALVAGLATVLLLASPRVVLAANKVEDLAGALLGDPSFKVRTQAALLLGKLGDKAGVEPLIKALADDNKTVRAMAAQSLGKLGGEAAAVALKKLLQRESDPFVRTQAEKAAAAIVPVRPADQDGKDRKVYLKFGPFTGGSKAADANLLGLLRSSIKQSLEKLPHVVVVEGAEEKNLGKGGRPAFVVDGNVLKLQDADAGSALETSCEVKVMVARWPSRSVILWTSAGAAVQGGKRDRDRQNARRDCIEASAGQLGDSLIGYFKSQGG
jgi:FOG: HEAT repeat